MIRSVHRAAGVVATLTIAGFWLSTALAELSRNEALIVQVKTLIPWGFLVLVPALIMTTGSGFRLARGRVGRRLEAKKRRAQAAAAIGIFILIPAALVLAARAHARAFDAMFYAVQAIELLFGAANLMLLGLNAWDGMKMRTR